MSRRGATAPGRARGARLEDCRCYSDTAAPLPAPPVCFCTRYHLVKPHTTERRPAIPCPDKGLHPDLCTSGPGCGRASRRRTRTPQETPQQPLPQPGRQTHRRGGAAGLAPPRSPHAWLRKRQHSSHHPQSRRPLCNRQHTDLLYHARPLLRLAPPPPASIGRLPAAPVADWGAAAASHGAARLACGLRAPCRAALTY